ncbi:hypothetical protein [Streptomyces sp. NPDC005374]|uniref:hypothetical protein n=1 Tax=Streptomyces sp. NPDC005374 TaxID=3364713 RepID=UPI00368FFD95
MPARIRRFVAPMVVVLVLGAGAWAYAARPGESAPVPDRSKESVARLALRPPINGIFYRWTEPQHRVALAKQRLIVGCMTKLGFRYEPAPVAEVTDGTAERPSPFGLEPLPPRGTEPSESLPPEQPRSKAFTRALYGDPDHKISAKGASLQVSRPADGCQAEAEQRLLGGTEGRLRYLRLRLQLHDGQNESLERLDQDAQFRAVNERWRTCVLRAGVETTDPVTLVKSLPADTDLYKHPAAQADLRCKGETDYLAISYTRLAAEQSKWLTENPEVLPGWRSLQLRQSTVAGEVLG